LTPAIPLLMSEFKLQILLAECQCA